ncbi:cobalamin-dependent protein [Leisingera sp. ANG-M1]|uniref:cobalamin-dependent protein n=1 Tax=Leisingera sp. ANG-M1 TaxID=1577895 RepID=UPI00068B7297|nr:cobalamin-dependent protein [Leisingera sp. ANG-M1]
MLTHPPLTRADILPEPELPAGRQLLDEGRQMADLWSVGDCAFLRAHGCASEAEYKRRKMAEGTVMQHAHLGFRDLQRSVSATASVYEACAERGAVIDRFGMCLDWSMGFPRAQRSHQTRGTGILLNSDEDFARLTQAAPAAMHFGDFMLGFPAALENTCSALAAGATAIGNLGQYFTFRLPGYTDDVETTAATVKALGLIAAQPVEVLVHSNLDDGYAAVYEDLTSALGQAMLEKYIITDLIGAPYAVCYGHHFTEPLTRIAFQRALAMVCDGVPGSQVYGATVLYKGNHAENYAGLSAYLLADIAAQQLQPTGHAVNPVPVSENERIPDPQEIIDAQCHLNRMKDLAEGYLPLLNLQAADQVRDTLLSEASGFRDRVLHGLREAGIDTSDPFELLLALRRLGGRALEQRYGAGSQRPDMPGRRQPRVPATTFTELEEAAEAFLDSQPGQSLCALARPEVCILTATTDVHEHGKMLLDTVFARAGFTVADGGISSDPADVAASAVASGAAAIALSTYNGVALRYARDLLDALAQQGADIPVLIGGRLNEIPAASNTSLPVDVSRELQELGTYPCPDLPAATQRLTQLLPAAAEKQPAGSGRTP